MQRSYMLKQLEWLNTWNSSVTEMMVSLPAHKQVKLFIGPLLYSLVYRSETQHNW